MICPKCEYEYIESVKICPDCNAELVSVEEYEGNLVNPKDYIIVFTTFDQIEAEMLKSNLEGAGIDSLILSQKDRNYPAVGDLSVVKLLVDKKNIEDAMDIIKDINNPDQE